ncbi:MAG: hypothetical protein C0394_12410 [Syntrophus sp. (in: bacteria)]|nr:hypothetical protein [Syntrophus sp. (in: bacteria)]
MQGRGRLAEISFQKAVSEIKSSGDIRLLQIAHLTRYALQVAVLESFDDQDYRKLEAIEPHPENIYFHAFLKGAFDRMDEPSLPPQYRLFLRACKSGKQSEIDIAIMTMEDPLSRLIAVGLAVQKQLYQETTLKAAIRTASEQGWKKALLVYLKKLRDFYTAGGEREKADLTQQKIDLIK